MRRRRLRARHRGRVPRHVAAVVRGVIYGLISQEEAQKRYAISAEEFREWVTAVTQFGEDALKATAVQKYRQP